MYAVKIMFMSGPHDGLEVWLKSNQGKGQAIVSGWEFTLGRGDDCDLTIPYDTQVSRTHAYLRVHDDAVEIQDAASRNGTFVRDERIREPIPLQEKEFFRIGHTWLRVEEVTR